ncbi:hypothetical protein JAAARDRAFT_190713 [Jaapia argillacea MUCL 33604]|uniref:Peptide hydrolase n=1 Tax=Jaapia argillacea MUCL 33604 TaxID=933084 RepID=A0A067Q775_9AGAM|nr:hypothetical protein JAAARDRAFT_190713 [Jaapia argillacea MUCL 33604]
MTRRWGPIRSLLILAPLLIGAPFLAVRQHYSLPEPITELINPQTNLPQLSETAILSHAKYLSEDIGYRTVGTREHALGDAWMLKKVEEIQEECERVVRESGGERKLECEVWRQVGSGSHRFDMMSKRLYKTYVNLTNIVLRISDGTPDSKSHAVLINAHLDSTLPSPGAADDALSVGVMLECARVMVGLAAAGKWEPGYAVIFLFNNAEESLQDGSHLFSTQHPIANTVRAAINLEAAGTTGPELLFQATSEQMIEAYSHVPRPFGTIVANEIFSSGILLSDTDFRQFEQYLNVTGLDMAVVGNSYLYHMRKDLVEHIQPGVAQHMADNALALLLHLSSKDSNLLSLDAGYTRPRTVYFSFMGFFFLYSFRTALILYSSLLCLSLGFIYVTFIDPSPALKAKGFEKLIGKVWWEQVRGLAAYMAGVLGALVGANVVAFLMSKVLRSGMSWFKEEFSCLVLYGPPSLAGALISQLFIGKIHEQTLLTSLLLVQSLFAFAIQLSGVGSCVLLFLTAFPLFISLTLHYSGITARHGKAGKEISLWTYVLGQTMPLLTGTQTICAILDFFVPLTGRIGGDAPADHVIASIVALTGAYTVPLALPFAHRFGRGVTSRAVVTLGVISVVLMGVFAMRNPFDDMHQKRLFVLHMENITTGEQHLHIASADGAPGFNSLVSAIASEYDAEGNHPTSVIMDEYNSDWDVLYPFSAFLSPFLIDMAVDRAYANESSVAAGKFITVSAERDFVDRENGTRSLTLVVDHPGVIWTSIAFDAHVLKWTLDDNPPDEYARHHIKEGSFYGMDRWTVDLVIKLPEPTSRGLPINFVGIKEQAMWPGKKAEKEAGGSAMRLFEKMDAWFEETTGGTVDPMLMGCVGGISIV